MEKVTQQIEKLVPSPLGLAFLLTGITLVLAFFFGSNYAHLTIGERGLLMVGDWKNGLLKSGLLAFAVEMMLILVLGHVIALSKPVRKLINLFISKVETFPKAVFLLTFITIALSFFNWGLSLVFGAVMAKSLMDELPKRGVKVNKGLLGACGYVGLMTWHGGFSGTAPLKSSDPGGIAQLLPTYSGEVPGQILLDETVTSNFNLLLFSGLLILIPSLMSLLSRRVSLSGNLSTEKDEFSEEESSKNLIDRSNLPGFVLGLMVLSYALYLIFSDGFFNAVNTKYVIFLFLGVSFILHGSINSYGAALEKAIGGVSGILIQFPLYFGVMGVMGASGLMQQVSEFFVGIGSSMGEHAYYWSTFFSAGLVNFFVPSGGGQWAVQGPVIIESCLDLGYDLPKSIMALSYGDQLTNMLQPFWALPLLSLTKLKAGQILPYTFVLFLIGAVLYSLVVLVF